MSIAEQVLLAEIPIEKSTEMKRIVVSSAIGTAVEWYDFLIYGTASALVFNKLFFPLSDPALGTMLLSAPMASASWPAPWAPRSSDISATGSAAKRCSR
jgi:hypothetical protein